MNNERYVELVTELEILAQTHTPGLPPSNAELTMRDVWQEPGLAVSALLYYDANGPLDLPDATVARLWEIGYLLGYDRDFLLDEKSTADARPERRTRPPQPDLEPLRGGGHGPGRGRPGKREFPARWSDDDAIEHTMAAAREPTHVTELPTGDVVVHGERDGVRLGVVVQSDGEVATGYPVSGPGVVQHPVSEAQQGWIDRLAALRTQHELPAELAEVFDELSAVGEWPYVVASIRQLTLGRVDPTQEREIDELADAADLPRL